MFGDKVSREEFDRLSRRLGSLENVCVDYSSLTAVYKEINEVKKLLADAIGMEFKTEAATPSKTVLVKKTEGD
jgi:hypothetical protein